MLLGVDHFVIAVGDLAALGFSVVPGGRHAAGTHNALIALAAGAYIELIAFHEPYPEHRWWTALGRGGGLVDYCLQTDDLAAATGAFRRAGVAMTDPKPSVRTRPDGFAVRWVLALAEGPQRGVAPFLIRDEGPRAERVPPESRHANGVTGLAAVTVAVASVGEAKGWYEAALGRPGEALHRDDLDADGVRFAIGPHALEFLQPRTERGQPRTERGQPRHGRGQIGQWVDSRGPRPYAARFTGGPPGAALDPRLTHGARLSFG
ncbi:MAG TPA: VOC family protein [Methylomirabilota bacterium]|nr:VOC family protein [Methylomirabilota bacterium]